MLIALSLWPPFVFIYPSCDGEERSLCSVSCLDSRCKAPHFVYLWTFQPIPSSSVSYSFYFSLVCRRLSTPFICFNLVAHYSKEKAFCIEKKTQLFFLFLCLTTNICSPLQIQKRPVSGSLPHHHGRLCECEYVCVLCERVRLLNGGKCVRDFL